MNSSTSDLTKQYSINGRFYENSWLKPKLKQEYSSSTQNLSSVSPNRSANDINELDDEANLLKRSNTRLSRKLSFKINNQNTSNSSLQKTETANLFNFLNSGLDQSRELPSEQKVKNSEINKPLSTNSTSHVSRDPNLFKFTGEGNLKIQPDISTISLSNIKRYSSTGSLNTLNNNNNGSIRQIATSELNSHSSIKEIPEETNEVTSSNIVKSNILEQKPSVIEKVNKNFVNTGVTTISKIESSSSLKPSQIDNDNKNTNTEVVFPITLRRSMSTTQADQAINKTRRDMFSAALSEETENRNTESQKTASTQNTQSSKPSNRLSGLKKLGSLYKTFEDDDVSLPKRDSICSITENGSTENPNSEKFHFVNQNAHQEQSNNSSNSSYIVSNIEGKIKLENNISNIKNDKTESNKTEDENVKTTTSVYRITNSVERTSSDASSQPKNNVNTENKANNCVNNNIQINRVNPIRLDNSSFKVEQSVGEKRSSLDANNFTMESSSVSHKPVEQLKGTESILDNKVKSLSKNWETVTTKPENNSKIQSNSQKSINNFPIKPNSISKFNSINKFRTHSEEDEGEIQINLSNENQVNFTGSHNSIIQAQLNKINQPQITNINSYQHMRSTTSINTNPSFNSIQQAKKEQEYRKENGHEYHINMPRQHNNELSRHSFHTSQDYVVNHNDFNTFENDINTKNKSIQNMYALKKPPIQHQSQQIPKSFQTKSSISVSNGSSSPPNTPPSNDDTNDNSKRKSVSALYLSDTASTKAKKSEIKHKDGKTVLTINNAPSIISTTVNSSYSTTNNNLFQNNISSATTNNNINNMINRRASLNTGPKKPIVNINMTKEAPISSQQLISFSQNAKNDTNISLSINCSTQLNSNHSQLSESQNSNLRLNENTGDIHKKTSVFDRLSRTIKKQHDIH